MPKQERVDWTERVKKQLLGKLPCGAEIILLVGLRYRKDIEPYLEEQGFTVKAPLARKKIGQQLKWLKENSK